MAGRIVVVGGGLAAGTTVSQLREGGYDGPLTVFTDEPLPPYERPPLSKDLLLGKGDPDDALVHEQGWYAEHDVDLRLGTPVTALDLAGKEVVAGDERSATTSCVLATGSRPRRLAMADDSGAPVDLPAHDGGLPRAQGAPPRRAPASGSSAAAGSASRWPRPPAPTAPR